DAWGAATGTAWDAGRAADGGEAAPAAPETEESQAGTAEAQPATAAAHSETPAAADAQAAPLEAAEAEAFNRAAAAEEATHRLGNAFALVGALIRLAAEEESDVQSFAAHLSERVGALAEANGALDAADPPTQDVPALLSRAVRPYLSDRGPTARVDGPAARLRPGAARCLALILHELATNAVKHGALSHAGGHLAATLARGPDGSLSLTW
ncbi:MAG: HWE histidine kinase domain-containing protein, partial [Pseudomonadota bacterium]